MKMDTVLGILLIVTYGGMVFFSVKGKNLTSVFFVMTLLWSILAFVGGSLSITGFLGNVIADSAKNYGANIITILFGSMFGRVLVETNIARSIVRKTAELGGDKAWLTMVLLSIVTSLICSSVSGLGIVMAIGVVIIPILLSLGIDKKIAVASFILSIGAGAFFNPGLTQYLTVLFEGFDITTSTYKTFAFIAYGVNMVVTISMSLVLLHRSRRTQAWAADVASPQAGQESAKDVPWYAMLTPLIPLVLCFGFSMDVIPAMLIAAFVAVLSSGGFKSAKTLQETIYRAICDGVSDSAMLIAFLIAAAMFNTICTICAPYFQGVIGGIIPRSPLILLIALIILVPSALYRGPLSAYGSGVAIVTILLSSGYFNDQFIFMLFACTSFGITLCACPTQSYTQWTINYTKMVSIDHLKTVFPWCWCMVAVNMIVAYLMFA